MDAQHPNRPPAAHTNAAMVAMVAMVAIFASLIAADASPDLAIKCLFGIALAGLGAYSIKSRRQLPP